MLYEVPAAAGRLCTKTQEAEFKSKYESPLQHSPLGVQRSTLNKYQVARRFQKQEPRDKRLDTMLLA